MQPDTVALPLAGVLSFEFYLTSSVCTLYVVKAGKMVRANEWKCARKDTVKHTYAYIKYEQYISVHNV